MGLNPQQVCQLVHPRENGQLLGHHLVHASPGEERIYPLLDRVPIAVQVEVDVGFLTPEIRGELHRLGAEWLVKAVGQGMGEISRKHNGAVAQLSATNGGGGRDRSLPYTALAGIENDSQW